MKMLLTESAFLLFMIHILDASIHFELKVDINNNKTTINNNKTDDSDSSCNKQSWGLTNATVDQNTTFNQNTTFGLRTTRGVSAGEGLFIGPFDKIWSYEQCSPLTKEPFTGLSLTECQEYCIQEWRCGAIHFTVFMNFCELLGCKIPAPKPYLNPSTISDNIIKGYARSTDCDLNWERMVLAYADCPGGAPLVLKHSNNTYEISSESRTATGSDMIFACPGRKNYFKKGPNDVNTAVRVQCDQGSLYLPKFKVYTKLYKLGCIQNIRPTASKSHLLQDPKNCVGELYEIVYDFVLKKKLFFFKTNILMCFDASLKTTLWTLHNIDGRNMGFQKSIVSPDFYVENTEIWKHLNALQINDAYSLEKQKKYFENKFGRSGFGDQTTQLYLARGHMAAKADFVIPAEQRATFVYINALPQWQSINNGNWKKIEDLIRRLASCTKRILSIYTGGHGKMTMQDMHYLQKEVFLGDSYDIIPVPSITWKIVSTDFKAVAFVVFNNPFGEVPPPFPMEYSRCKELKDWLFMTEEELNNDIKGITYCFTVQEFRDYYSDIKFADFLGSSVDESALLTE